MVPGAGIGPNVYLFSSIGWRLHDERGKARSAQLEKLSQAADWVRYPHRPYQSSFLSIC
jgi:hypothetical protein